MTAAYEAALVELKLIDRSDPITELIAQAIVRIATIGERDPKILKQDALHSLGVDERTVSTLSQKHQVGSGLL